MRQLALGLVSGLLLASTAHSQEPRIQRLEEAEVGTISGTTFAVPAGYGRLVNVVVDSEVHHLYFEDADGTIRVVLVGNRGAAARARNPLQLLTSTVHVIERGAQPVAAE
jgi:hypothetical protein